MQRIEFIEKIKSKGICNEVALKLAATVTTPAEVAALKLELKRAERVKDKWESRWTKFAFGLLTGSIVSFVAYLVLLTMRNISTEPDFTGTDAFDQIISMTGLAGVLCFMFFVIFGIVSVNIYDSKQEDIKILEKLEPIGTTNSCKEALEYVQIGYPSVKAWRDLVIEERGQLLALDVYILRALHFMEKNERDRAATRKVNDEACRKLHGLEVAVPTETID